MADLPEALVLIIRLYGKLYIHCKDIRGLPIAHQYITKINGSKTTSASGKHVVTFPTTFLSVQHLYVSRKMNTDKNIVASIYAVRNWKKSDHLYTAKFIHTTSRIHETFILEKFNQQSLSLVSCTISVCDITVQ